MLTHFCCCFSCPAWVGIIDNTGFGKRHTLLHRPSSRNSKPMNGQVIREGYWRSFSFEALYPHLSALSLKFRLKCEVKDSTLWIPCIQDYYSLTTVALENIPFPFMFLMEIKGLYFENYSNYVIWKCLGTMLLNFKD